MPDVMTFEDASAATGTLSFEEAGKPETMRFEDAVGEPMGRMPAAPLATNAAQAMAFPDPDLSTPEQWGQQTAIARRASALPITAPLNQTTTEQVAGSPGPLVTLPEAPPVEESTRLPREAMLGGMPTESLLGPQAADVQAQVQRSLYNAAKQVPEFLTSEEGMLAGLASMTPLGKAGVQAYFTYDMAKSVLDQAKKMGEDWDSISTLEKASRLTQAIATLGFTGLLVKAGVGNVAKAIPARPGPFQGPLPSGDVLVMPPGAPAPRVEPPLIERSTDPAAQAAQMQREAVGGGGIDPQAPPRPVVPGEPAENRAVPTPEQEDLIAQQQIIKTIRFSKATTKEAIRELFPEMNRQQAAQWRDRVWGKATVEAPSAEGAARAVIEQGIEGGKILPPTGELTEAELQAARDTFAELAKRGKDNPPEPPSPAPTPVPKPPKPPKPSVVDPVEATPEELQAELDKELGQEPTNPAPDAASTAESTAKEIGYTFNPANQIGSMSMEGLTQAEIDKLAAAGFKPEWEFTDRRKGSPTESFTFYVPEGSSAEVIRQASKEQRESVEAKKPAAEPAETAAVAAKRKYSGEAYRSDKAEFERLIKEHAVEQGWHDDPSLLEPAEGYADMFRQMQMKKAITKAFADLGIKADRFTEQVKAQALPKLKEHLAKYAKLVEVPVPPDGSEFTILGEKHIVEKTNPDTGIVTIKDGRTLKVDENHTVKIDPGSLKTAAVEDFGFEPAESVEEQKARAESDKSAALKASQGEAVQSGSAKPLVGSVGDIGQGDLLGGGDLFSASKKPTPDAPASVAKGGTDLERIADKVDRNEKLTPSERKQWDAAQAKTEADKPSVESGPGTMAGPGSPSRTQGPDTGGGWTDSANEDIMGVRQVTREKQAAVGQPVVATPNEGTNLVKSLADGRDRLARDPAAADRVRENFDRTGQFNESDFNVVRAKYEQVMAEGRKTAQKFGTMSPEYHAARLEAYAWSDLTKRMQTAWHKMGMGQQGETDIDTGSILDLENAYHDATGQDFTPGQRQKGTKIAKAVSDAKTAVEKAKPALDAAIDKIPPQAPNDLPGQKNVFSDFNTGQPMTPLQVKTIWKRARSYIDSGNNDHADVVYKVAEDFGIPAKDVAKGIAQNKTVKRVADDVWQKQRQARMLKGAAKRWVNGLSETWLQKVLPNTARFLFSAKVGLHGTVALGTHAPLVVATHPIIFAENFGKMYKLVASPEYYQMQQREITRRPNFTTAQRAGLVNDMSKMEDFNDPRLAMRFPKMSEWFKSQLDKVHLGRLVGMGTRGYSVLKVLRQDLFDHEWNKLSESHQTTQMAKAIADSVNHITGVDAAHIPKVANYALFAPKLLLSRVKVIAGDPARSVNSLLKMENMTPEQKWFATNQFKEKAKIFGVATGLLIANQQLNNLFGDKKKLNGVPVALGGAGFNPMESDFMKFRVAGMNVAWGSPFLTMSRLPLRVIQIGMGNGGKTRFIIYPDESMYKTVGSYLRTQESPFLSPIMSLVTKADWQDRPLPQIPGYGPPPPVPKRLRSQGVQPYTWPEFTSEIFMPIPIEEGAREIWHYGLGANPEQHQAIRKSFLITILMAATGGRIQEDWKNKP